MKTTQRQKILEYLQAGGKLTPIDALGLFGCYRLGARVYELKCEGYIIDREMVEVQCRAGHTARVAQYSMDGGWW